MRHPRGRCGRGHDRGDLAGRPPRSPGQQCRRQLPGQERDPLAKGCRCRGAHRPQRHGLCDAGLRPALDRRGPAGGGRLHRHLLCLHRLALRAALGHGQGGRARHDPQPGRRVGAPRRSASTPSPPVPSRPRALGSAWCPAKNWPRPGATRSPSAASAITRSWPTSPPTSWPSGSGYVTGEVVTIDGGEWLKGAAQFALMEALSEEDWAAMRGR